MGGGVSQYDYRSNAYYDAYLSTFRLNDRQADIVFLGDSITLGGRWDEFFQSKNVLNRGIGSDVSEGCLNRLDEIEKHAPKMIFLMIGCNDLARHILQDEIVGNVEQILTETAEKLPECTIYLQSVLPFDEDLQRTQELNSSYQKLADRYEQCIYVDLYPLFLDENGQQNRNLFSTDRVHLNGEGYRIWINAISCYVYDENGMNQY